MWVRSIPGKLPGYPQPLRYVFLHLLFGFRFHLNGWLIFSLADCA